MPDSPHGSSLTSKVCLPDFQVWGWTLGFWLRMREGYPRETEAVVRGGRACREPPGRRPISKVITKLHLAHYQGKPPPRRSAAPRVPLGKPGRLAKGRGPKADGKRRGRRDGLGQAAGECPPIQVRVTPLWKFPPPSPITTPTPVLNPHSLPEPRKASS